MAQQVVDAIRARPSPKTSAQTLPTLGLRGGLGKTLLIAFLVLAITPLSLLALLTYHQIQQNTGQRVMASLETMVTLKEAHLVDWVQGYERELALVADQLGTKSPAPSLANGSELSSPSPQSLGQTLEDQLAAVRATDPGLAGLILVDRNSREIAGADGDIPGNLTAWLPAAGPQLLIVMPPEREGFPPVPAVSFTWADWWLIGLLDWSALWQIVDNSAGAEAGIDTRLLTGDGWMATSQTFVSLHTGKPADLPEGINRALLGQSGSGAYENLEGVPVFGAYHWNPELQIALVAEQPQTLALAAGDAMTAVVIGGTLAVALITAAIAAFVTRRLTVPIVQLTETAAWMARGDLNQTVQINRKDELGILARAFNRMAAELRILYGELEAKVAERTRQLEEANEHTRYHATRLALSAEVARVVSSIRDLDRLLETVVELIGRAFELDHASVYLLDQENRWAICQASSNPAGPLLKQAEVGGSSLIGCVAAEGKQRAVRAAEPATMAGLTVALQPPLVCEMGVPLQVRHQVLGVLDLQSSRDQDFDENDQMVYQSLADQISIAIENARAYEAERKTVERLQELDRIQSQFLTNMSHALRTPLTSIIGFSRIMLKELDGPTTDLQRTDLNAIHQSGRQLLGLINDMLELSQLDLGTAPFSLTEVDLTEIIEGVMATARALAGTKPVQLYQTMPADLKPICTDGQRVRQVILALLSNAVKYTDQGRIDLCVTQDDGRIAISVSDTGTGIPQAEQAQFLADISSREETRESEATGFGLAISKRVVEKLGGEIWLDSVEGVGSTFTFTLPVKAGKQEAGDGVAEHAAEA
jgi:signal transduction histidine kinase/HAMP domain-containing protein